MEILVGYTGFVGSNLLAQHTFDAVYRSTDIQNAFGSQPYLCVYAGVRAEKFLANSAPEQDMAQIREAMENIRRIRPKRLVLISTIDVFQNPIGPTESTRVETQGLHSYGLHRHLLEEWAKDQVEHLHILRLPGLFGRNIKKNFIYDLIHPLPSLLNEGKYREFSSKEPLVADHYKKQDNGFYKLTIRSEGEEAALLQVFERLQFSALQFTDGRGVFQFYPLAHLWEHLQIVLRHRLPLLHLAVEPTSVQEVYRAVRGEAFVNDIAPTPPQYDFRTEYAPLFGGRDGYIFSKKKILADIAAFVAEQTGRERSV